MSLPFTHEAFFEVLVRYNQSVWPIQIVLNAVAILCVAILFLAGAVASRITSFLLASLWVWMAIVYHFTFFIRINPAAWLFGAVFLVGSAVFMWLGVINAQLRFRAIGGIRGTFAWILVAFALAVYPAIGYTIGHRYPAAPTFGLPCPTTIFTLGLLLFADPPFPARCS